jgi:hypothetical protein
MRRSSSLLAFLLIATLCSPQAASFADDVQDRQLQRDQRVEPLKGDMEDAIETVQMANLMKGYPDGQFHPEKTISRAELASIIVKAFDLKNRERNPHKKVLLKDVPPEYWAAQDIGLVTNLGIMAGYRDGYFYPNHPISRAEALSVIAQAYGVYQFDESIISAILSNYPDSAQIPAWARKAVATSLKAGFVDTPVSGYIRPLQPMTRGEMAYALYQYLQKENQPELPQSE